MGITDNNHNIPPNVYSYPFSVALARLGVALIVVLLPLSSAVAAVWKITPSISASETYTDNVNLAPAGKEKNDLITSLAPGVSIQGDGSRLKLNAHYRAQGVIYAREHGRNHIYNQFRGSAQAELMRDYLFMDAGATATQQLLTPSQGVYGNNIGGASTTNVYTYRLSPYFRHRFGGVADTLLRYTNYGTRYATGTLADATGNRVDARMKSGRDFGRLGWALSYDNDHLSRKFGGDIKNETGTGNVSYRLTNSLRAIAQGGYEHHSFLSASPTYAYQNGTYWAGGFGWQPNRHLMLEGLYGSRYKSVTAQWRPTARTSLKLGWLKRSVGLNPGRSWNGSFTLRSPHFTWNARYSVDTISSQQALQGDNGYYVCDPATKICNFYIGLPPLSALPANPLISQPTSYFFLTNEVYTRKRGQLAIRFHTARTNASVMFFNERRHLLLSNTNSRAYGGSAFLRWRFGGRTSLLLSGSGQYTRYFDTGQTDKLWYASAGLSRRVTPRTTTALTYRHTALRSTGVRRSYRENRLEASIHMRFQ